MVPSRLRSMTKTVVADSSEKVMELLETLCAISHALRGWVGIPRPGSWVFAATRMLPTPFRSRSSVTGLLHPNPDRSGLPVRPFNQEYTPISVRCLGPRIRPP